MKLVKSLLLGTAAGLAAVAGAQAADLPARKAAPVDYVRVCSPFGTGFWYLPGTETCIRVSGRVRAEGLYSERFSRAADTFGYRAVGRITLDAATATAYGPLRARVRFDGNSRTGTYRNATGTPPSSGDATLGLAEEFNLDKAFITWAGITAGRTNSLFDFYANDLNWGGSLGSDTNTNLFAYTASFGGGVSATLSLEDPSQRRAAGTGFTYGGQAIPDVIGNVRVEQAWGVAQLSAAWHQIPNADPTGDTEYGWAVQGGLRLNLSQIAPGDVLWLQAAYADGAASYLGLGGTIGGWNGVSGRFGDAFGADADTASGYSFVAAFLHYWTPQIRQGVFGGYAATTDIPSAFSTSVGETALWQVGTNLIWSPVQALDIGVEVLYRNVDVDAAGITPSNEEGQWQGRIRIQRDF